MDMVELQSSPWSIVRSTLLHLFDQRAPKGKNPGFPKSYDFDMFSSTFEEHWARDLQTRFLSMQSKNDSEANFDFCWILRLENLSLLRTSQKGLR